MKPEGDVLVVLGVRAIAAGRYSSRTFWLSRAIYQGPLASGCAVKESGSRSTILFLLLIADRGRSDENRANRFRLPHRSSPSVERRLGMAPPLDCTDSDHPC